MIFRAFGPVVLFAAVVLAACSTVGVRTEGTSGPIAWRVVDPTVVSKTVEGQPREDYAFTLALRNTGTSTLTITSIEMTVYQAGGGHAALRTSTGVWVIGPGVERGFPLSSYQFCNFSEGCIARGTFAPMWNLVFRGKDAANRDISIPVALALPAVAAGKTFQASAPARPLAQESRPQGETRTPVTASPPTTPDTARPTETKPDSRPANQPPPPAAPAADSTKASTIPVLIVENVVLVPATLNRSHGATLLLDTGAQHTIVTPALAGRLNLAPRPGGTKRTITVVGGKKIDVPFVRLPALEIGSASLVDVEVGVFDVAPESPIIDGLLGADVLSRYRMTVDHAARQLRLDPLR